MEELRTELIRSLATKDVAKIEAALTKFEKLTNYGKVYHKEKRLLDRAHFQLEILKHKKPGDSATGM